MTSKKDFKFRKEEIKRAHRLERIEERHRARLSRIRRGEPMWLRVVLGLGDVFTRNWFLR